LKKDGNRTHKDGIGPIKMEKELIKMEIELIKME
jgi:hypothetical protein